MTSTGETKVIERYDCSGCGDVDTSTIIRTVTDGGITGLTGRKLKVNTGLFCCRGFRFFLDPYLVFKVRTRA